MGIEVLRDFRTDLHSCRTAAFICRHRPNDSGGYRGEIAGTGFATWGHHQRPGRDNCFARRLQARRYKGVWGVEGSVVLTPLKETPCKVGVTSG